MARIYVYIPYTSVLAYWEENHSLVPHSHLWPITVYVNMLILPLKCGESIYFLLITAYMRLLVEPGEVPLSHTFNGSILYI